MRIRWLVLTVVPALVFLHAEQAPSQEGTPFAPKNEMFTVVMPAGEKTGQRTKILTIGKHKVPIETSYSTSKNGPNFTGGSIGIPAVVMRDIPADKRFDIFRDLLAKQLNGQVTDEKDLKQDPVVGKEYQIKLSNGAARMQIYTVAGWVVHAIVESKTKGEVNSKQADAFFESLKLADKAKDVFKNAKR